MTQINNIANSQYAKEASNYIKILNELRRVGAHFAINLPTMEINLPTKVACLRQYDNPIETKFGSLINDPYKVELMTRRAQKALLNPITDSNKFIKDEDGPQFNGLKFTKNIIFIELKDEIDNQAIITLTKEADHLEVRTLGVFTKPDKIEKGTNNLVKDYGRIGVKNLQNKLSELLIKSIKRGLTSIRNDVEEKLNEENFPMQLSDNPRIELFRMIKNCFTIIKEKSTCSNDQTVFWKSLNEQFETFDILEDFIEGHRSNTSTDQLQQITEAQVNKIIRNSRGRLLPGSIPYSAAQTMINEIQRTTYPFTLDKQMMTNLKTKYLNSLHVAVKNDNRNPTDTLEVMALVMAYLIAIKRYNDLIMEDDNTKYQRGEIIKSRVSD
ncbi:hypothetical protein C2G38_2181273 [Gigaspora rosea]|uniref:Dynamin stalk domain-containing protein n=1 Tax=Gigaspora rosea TaxID=44941 RepID=A0A397VB45_9GLOM|nr:hypothetical protein C2G38_2181273 [Gigaspora rosea]